jgi:transposase
MSEKRMNGLNLPGNIWHFELTSAKCLETLRYKYLYNMPLASQLKTKQEALRATGTFNARSAQVRHPIFQRSEFFDPEDLLQLKYETLRALETDGYSIARAASDFGLSRPTIYQAQQHFQKQGLQGLLPRKRGPKQPRKLTPKILEHLQELLAADPQLKAAKLAARLRQRFRVKVHPRTIEKAFKSKAKRGPQPPS